MMNTRKIFFNDIFVKAKSGTPDVSLWIPQLATTLKQLTHRRDETYNSNSRIQYSRPVYDFSTSMTKQRAVQYAKATVYVSQDIHQILNNSVEACVGHPRALLTHEQVHTTSLNFPYVLLKEPMSKCTMQQTIARGACGQRGRSDV